MFSTSSSTGTDLQVAVMSKEMLHYTDKGIVEEDLELVSKVGFNKTLENKLALQMFYDDRKANMFVRAQVYSQKNVSK